MNRKPSRLLVAVLFSVAAQFGARPAKANGRYPAAQQLVLDPGNPNRLWLRATYGVLTSGDKGKTWDWICESAIGYGPREDPLLAVSADGQVFAAAAEGLLQTSDRGCSWSRNPEIGSTNVLDIALERDQKHLLALTQVPVDDHYQLLVHRSDSETRHFETVGEPPFTDLIGYTIDPAPSDANRIYVTAAVFRTTPAPDESDVPEGPPDGPGVLLRSEDGGATWSRSLIPGASIQHAPFIAAVDPTNPDVLYVRTQGAINADGFVESALLYTDDAGETWREIFRGPGDLLGFALSADGTRVSVGLGDTLDRARPVDRDAIGIYRAETATFEFERVFVGQVGCLNESGDRLFVCGNQDSEGFELGVSTDQGGTIAKVLSLGEVRGPVSCPTGALTPRVCSSEWKSACSLVGQCDSSVNGEPTGAPSSEVGTVDASKGCTVGSVSTSPRGWPTPLCLGAVATLVARAARRSKRQNRKR